MDWLIVLLLIFSLVLSFGIGAQDETMATTFGSGSLKLRTAVLLGGFLAFIGVLFLSTSVGETIGSNLLGPSVEYNAYMMLAVLLGTASWLLIATRTQVPISTTHSVVGAVFGISFIWCAITGESYWLSINWIRMGQVALGWIVSPLLGYFGALGGHALLNHYLKKKSTGLLQIEKTENIFRYLIIIFACLNQISRGGNDSGNAIGIFYGLVQSNQVEGNLTLFILAAAVAFSLGLILIGKNLVKSVGNSTGGKLRPSDAVTIEGTTALIIFFCTLLGLPVSGGHILIFAMIGNSRMKGESPDRKSFRRMLISWTITFPVTAALSASFYYLIFITVGV